MQPQLSTLELARFPMEKIDERHSPRCNPFLRVITMCMEEVSIIARGDLHLRSRDGKLLDPELFQNLWQHSSDPFEDYLLVRSQLHQNARATMAVVSFARLPAGRNHLAVPELRFMLLRIANQFFHLLRSQELIQHYAPRPNHCGSFQHSDATVGSRLAFLCFLSPNGGRMPQINARWSARRLRSGKDRCRHSFFVGTGSRATRHNLLHDAAPQQGKSPLRDCFTYRPRDGRSYC